MVWIQKSLDYLDQYDEIIELDLSLPAYNLNQADAIKRE
jgi:hypothetical protein